MYISFSTCFFNSKSQDRDRKEMSMLNILAEGTGLSSVITPAMLNGVLEEIIGLLPVVIPVMVGFIALRKGIAFIQSVLHSA